MKLFILDCRSAARRRWTYRSEVHFKSQRDIGGKWDRTF